MLNQKIALDLVLTAYNDKAITSGITIYKKKMGIDMVISVDHFR